MLFCELLKKDGYKSVAKKIGENSRTVRSWSALTKAPRPSTSLKIIDAYEGTLTWEDIYLPHAIVKSYGFSTTEAIEQSKQIIESRKESNRGERHE